LSWILILEQSLNGLQFGLMLFLLAAGLTLVFGIMDMINLAHGSLYMLGAFIASTLVQATGSFVAGVLLAIPATAILGMVLEISVLRTLYARDHLSQVLATFALILIINELTRLAWGSDAALPMPQALSGPVELLPGLRYPAYRLVIIAVGVLVALLLFILVTKTRVGMRVRAGASNREMALAMGVDIKTLFTLVFGVGAGLCAVAGAMLAPLFAVQVGMGENILILAFVVIVIGGIGSIRGALVGAVLVGIVDTIGRAFLPILFGIFFQPRVASAAGPATASVMIYLLMAVVLFLRTRGVYFIMITLAFAQMAFYLVNSMKAYGGDEGLTLLQRAELGLGLDLGNEVVFYYVALLFLALSLYGLHRVMQSRFGRVVIAIRENEARAEAIGLPVYRYQLACFVIAGAVAGLGGALLASHGKYVHPNVLHWVQSGTLMIMVILGGVGQLWGGAIGAVVLLGLEHVISDYPIPWLAALAPNYPQHANLGVGLVMLAIVLFAPHGVAGLLSRRRGA